MFDSLIFIEFKSALVFDHSDKKCQRSRMEQFAQTDKFLAEYVDLDLNFILPKITF